MPFFFMRVQFPESGWENGWYVVPHEVTWRDLDAIGHVNNAVFLTYFEWARTKYWQTLTNTKAATDLTFIVARVECNFRKQLAMGDRIRICVRISELRGSSFDFESRIELEHGKEIAADGRVVVVMFSWEKREKIALSDEFKRRVEEFQKE